MGVAVDADHVLVDGLQRRKALEHRRRCKNITHTAAGFRDMDCQTLQGIDGLCRRKGECSELLGACHLHSQQYCLVHGNRHGCCSSCNVAPVPSTRVDVEVFSPGTSSDGFDCAPHRTGQSAMSCCSACSAASTLGQLVTLSKLIPAHEAAQALVRLSWELHVLQ